MELAGRLVNNTYNVKEQRGEDFFYTIWEAVSIFSANSLLLYSFRQPVSGLSEEEIDTVRKNFFKAYDIQTPYLYKPFETGTFEDRLFFVYLEIENITLKTLMDTGIRLPLEISLKIIINTLRALKLLEKRGLSHNMITPDTIWLTETGPEITNIKLSGFLDYLLWPHLGKEKKRFLDKNLRYLGKSVKESSVIESDTGNDIYSVGIILAEMLAGKPFTSEVNTKLTGKIPGWLDKTLKKMIDSPGSFSSIEELLDIFINNSPEHSILEDSIEERIVDTHQGGNYSKLMDPEEEAVEVEEVEKITEKTGGRTAEKVKDIVSFIFSLFKRRKKGPQKGSSREDSVNEEPEEETAPLKQEESGRVTESFPEKREDNTSHIEKTDNDLTIDPWRVDKNRYQDRNTGTEETRIPVDHNKTQGEAGKEKTDSESSREERNYKTSDTASFTIPGKSENNSSPEISPEERIAAMNMHRENTSSSPAGINSETYKQKPSSIRKSEETKQEKFLGEDRIKNREPASPGYKKKNTDTSKSENKKDSIVGIPADDKAEDNRLSFFQKIIRKLKKLLHLQ